MGIRPWESEQVSSVVAAAANRLVRWNTNSIASAICELDPCARPIPRRTSVWFCWRRVSGPPQYRRGVNKCR